MSTRIIAVPTLVAGLYSMNFQWLPGAAWHYGSVLLTVFVLGLCATMYLRFRRSGWL